MQVISYGEPQHGTSNRVSRDSLISHLTQYVILETVFPDYQFSSPICIMKIVHEVHKEKVQKNVQSIKNIKQKSATNH